MKVSQTAINRPVFATVMTMVLVLVGLLSFTRLVVREYPDVHRPVVSVRTIYPGASARLVETELTTIMEETFSGIEGLKSLTSVSREEVSLITLEFERSRDLDAASNDVHDRIARVRRQFPSGSEEPIVVKEGGDDDEVLWLALLSDRHTELEITDFAERHLLSQFSVLTGISQVYLDGQRRYAMRIWLDADRLAARLLTVQDIEDALHAQNIAIPSGRIEGMRREYSVMTRGGLSTPGEFNELIVAFREGYPVRLQEVGGAELGAEDDRKIVRVNGRPAVGLGIMKQSTGNALAVARAVKQLLPQVEASLPTGMHLQIAFDSTVSIEQSLHEVYVAMGFSLALVIVVILLFCGSLRATVIPAVVIPASIVATFTLLYLLGCSLNLVTLLGLVLAVGLVVDDAIVVLENIERRIEEGLPPSYAAVEGSREIGFAVVATTLSLIAVFLPIAFLKGTIGRLFSELALAIAGSVIVSGFIALTLTPMMCSLILRRSTRPGGTLRLREWLLNRLTRGYQRSVAVAIRMPGTALFFCAVCLVSAVWLLTATPRELAPEEDAGWFVGLLVAPEGSTIRYTDEYVRQLEALYAEVPEIRMYYSVVGKGSYPTIVNRGESWASLSDWSLRSRTTQDIVRELTPRMAAMSGVRGFPNNPLPFSQSSSKPAVQLVIGGTSYEELERQVRLIVEKAKALKSVVNLNTDLDLNKPELEVELHRNKAADLGVSLATVGRTLETLLGGRPITSFIQDGKAYRVVVKVSERDRGRPSDIEGLYVRGTKGEPVQLRNLVTVHETVAPRALNHYDKMRAVTLSASVAPGYSLGEALEELERTAREVVPLNTRLSYAGESKEFHEATAELAVTFCLALLVSYLVLAAQFESYVHPITILLSVPPALTGALMTLHLTGGTLNIYSEIGLVMLIGLVAKNAILIVEFANQLRSRGYDVLTAITEAATMRLRPILMTSLATILGALPLAVAHGAGASSRRQLGAVIISGLFLSTICTLYLSPAVYALLAPRSRPQHSRRPCSIGPNSVQSM